MYFVDPETGERLLNYREQDAARRAAEARVAELEALLRETGGASQAAREDGS